MARTTITHEDTAPDGDCAPPVPWLYFVLLCQDLGVPSLRLSLLEVDDVILGRGDELSVTREREAGRQRLVVRVPDPWMSSTHVTLSRVDSRFLTRDAGSKNGTLLNGLPLKQALLLGDALLELGRSFFVLSQHPASLAVEDREMGTNAGEVPGLATLQPELERDLERLRTLAPTLVPIEIRGETGTGKELIARAVHRLSHRRGQLVAVNCGAIPSQLVESHLFGHTRGAFSGAVVDHPGLLPRADGGTFFLDEIGDLPLPAQAALLRALQDGQVLPVGGVRATKVEARIVSATHLDLPGLVKVERFRADLHARLSGYTLRLPPLRERRIDLGVLVRTLTAGHGEVKMSREAARALFAHSFPQNVRELERALSVALALSGGDKLIELQHLPEAVRRPPDPLAIKTAEAPEAVEVAPLSPEQERHRNELCTLLERHAGNVAAVGRELGKGRMQVHRWMKRYALDPESFRRS